nr:hypothetical protein [uncultured Merdimonas sp.]
MASLLDGFEDDTTKAYDKKVDVASEKNRRATALVSMTKAEKERLTSRARAHGLSLSVFFRLAVDEYMRSYD